MKHVMLALALVSVVGCASAPPAGTDLRQFHAQQLLADVQTLSTLAQSLHTNTGTFQLSDHDAQLVQTFATSAGAGIQAYGAGKGTLAVVSAAFHDLVAGLSTEAALNDRIKFVLTLVDSALSVVLGSTGGGA
jgi:hypothetical protein